MIDLDSLKYAELQKLAKVHGVRANQKAAVLKEQLAKILAQDAVVTAEATLDEGAVDSADTQSVDSPATSRKPPTADKSQAHPSSCAPLDEDGDKENQAIEYPRSSHSNLVLPLAKAGPAVGDQRESHQTGSSPPRRQSNAFAAPTSRPGSRLSNVGRFSAGTDSSESCQRQPEASSSIQLPLPGCSPIFPGTAGSATSLASGADVNSSLLDSSLGLVDGSYLNSTSESRDDVGLTRSPDCRLSTRLRSSLSPGRLDGGNDCTFLIDGHRTDDASLQRTSNRSCRSAGRRTPSRCTTADVEDSRRSSVFAVARPSASSPNGRPSRSFDCTAASVVSVSRVTPSCDSSSRTASTAGRSRFSGGRNRSSTTRSVEIDLGVEVSTSDCRPEQLSDVGRLSLLSDEPSSAGVGASLCTSADGGDGLLSSMQQHMSDEELKASLLAALDRQTELRQAEIAERVAKARAQAQTASTRKDVAVSGSSKTRHTPNFATIHAKRFAKMESIQSYVDRKRQKFEDSNRLLGLSSPQLSLSTASSSLTARRDEAAKTTGSALRSTKAWPHSSLASAAATTASFAPKMSPRTSATASVLSSRPLFGASSARLQQESKNSGACFNSNAAAAVRRGSGGGARIVKPLRGGGGVVGSGSSGSSRGVTAARAVQRPTAPQSRLTTSVKPAVPGQKSAAALLPDIVFSPAAAAAKPFNLFAVGSSHAAAAVGAASGNTGSGLLSSSSSILNTTFTISRTSSEPKAGTFTFATTKPAALQASSGASKPAAAGYKKPMLKTSQQRRAEAVASAKDRRQATMMHRRLADN